MKNILLITILISFITSLTVSFFMMKFQMKLLEKWTDDFFAREYEDLKRIFNEHTH